MAPGDKPKFAVTIAALAAAFGKESDEALIQGYWMGLDDLEIESLDRGCRRALRECKFMPLPAELRSLSGEVAPAARVGLAWDAAAKTIRRIGTYASVSFDDPLVNATIRSMGGWQRFGLLGDEEFNVWARKEFERIYAAYCQTGVGEDACKHLPGVTETSNSARGYETEVQQVVCGLPPHRDGLVRPALGGSPDFLRLVMGEK